MKQKLTAREEMLMNIFWAHEPLFIRDLISYIPEPKPHYNTVATLVKFLEEKPADERAPLVARQIYDLALMSHKPLTAEEMTAFSERSLKLLEMLIQ